MKRVKRPEMMFPGCEKWKLIIQCSRQARLVSHVVVVDESRGCCCWWCKSVCATINYNKPELVYSDQNNLNGKNKSRNLKRRCKKEYKSSKSQYSVSVPKVNRKCLECRDGGRWPVQGRSDPMRRRKCVSGKKFCKIRDNKGQSSEGLRRHLLEARVPFKVISLGTLVPCPCW